MRGGRCTDCRHWMRDGAMAQRGEAGRVLRAVCSCQHSPHRGARTSSSQDCSEFEHAALHTLLRHEDAEKLARETAEFRVAYLPAATGETTDCAASVPSLDSMALTDGTGGFGGPAEALQRSVCALLLR